MNFLAHSLMGFDDPALIAGQFSGDFVRGRYLDHFPERLEAGIRLHRHLDRFTDGHLRLQGARAALDGVPFRFSGIVADVLFDHHLAVNWPLYSSRTLQGHARQVNLALDAHYRHLPVALQRFARVLYRERILERNVELSSIELTLQRLSQRSPRFAPLAMNSERLADLLPQLQPAYEEFYPDLLQAAMNWLAGNGQPDFHNHQQELR